WLVEDDDAVELRIEETPVHGCRACARPTVQEKGRHTVGITALLPVNRMAAIDRQHAAGEGRDFRKQVGTERGLGTRHANTGGITATAGGFVPVCRRLAGGAASGLGRAGARRRRRRVAPNRAECW